MGIQGLTKKIQDTPQCWSQDDGTCKIVIDGHAFLHYVCAVQRRNFACSYHEFSKIFSDILEKIGIERIAKVIFDGATSKIKLPTTQQRQKEKQNFATTLASYIHFGQGSRCRENNNHLKMPFCEEAAIAVLQSLKIDYEIWDEEADERVVQEAVRLDAAALSQDSDFFVANIPRGYMPISRFLKKRTICKYTYSSFCEKFDLKPEQVAQLPCFMGCDYTPVGEKGMGFDDAVNAIKHNKPIRFPDVEWPRALTKIENKQRDLLHKGEYHRALIDVENLGVYVTDVLVETEDIAWKATQAIRAHVYSLMKIEHESIKEYVHDRTNKVEPCADEEKFGSWASLSHDDLFTQCLRYSIKTARFNEPTVAALIALYNGGVKVGGVHMAGGNPVEMQGKEAEDNNNKDDDDDDENNDDDDKKGEDEQDGDGWEQHTVKQKNNKKKASSNDVADLLDKQLQDLAVTHHNHWQALCCSVRMLLHVTGNSTTGWFQRFWCMGENFFAVRACYVDLKINTSDMVSCSDPESFEILNVNACKAMNAAVWKDLKVEIDEKKKKQQQVNKPHKQKSKAVLVDKPKEGNRYAFEEEEEEEVVETTQVEEEEVVEEDDAEPEPVKVEAKKEEPKKEEKGKKGKKGKKASAAAGGGDDDIDSILSDIGAPKLPDKSDIPLTKAQLKRAAKKGGK